jgi:hypothetical protein
MELGKGLIIKERRSTKVGLVGGRLEKLLLEDQECRRVPVLLKIRQCQTFYKKTHVGSCLDLKRNSSNICGKM